MNNIRKARIEDLIRISEIEVFNYRLNFYPIFRNDDYYFNELSVPNLIKRYENRLNNIYVYDDGVIKGFIEIENYELKKLFVEPVLQNQSIGTKLLKYAIDEFEVAYLWALKKNIRAINFYLRNGFVLSDEIKLEEGTSEYLIKMNRK